jgi:Protein of unknown function (DUF2630)
MDDPQIHGTIENLVAEEHELWERESTGEASEDDRRRLEEIRVLGSPAPAPRAARRWTGPRHRHGAVT